MSLFRERSKEIGDLKAHVLCIGGEDHHLRIPFLLALADRGTKVTAAGTGNSAPFARAGIDYHPFRFDRFINPLADWSAIRALRGLITDIQPDIAQSFDTKPNLLVPLATPVNSGVAVIRTINGLGWIYSSRSVLALTLSPVYRALHRLAARSTAMTVFQNRDDQSFFEHHALIGSGLSRLIPGSGIDIGLFERTAAAGPTAAELRRTLGLEGCEIVITVTRLTRQKGIPTLLEAAALVHQARPAVRFVLVGPRESEGPLAVTQAEIDRHAPYVMAIGPRSDVPSLLKAADVFAFPTEYREGVPRALMEAALAGLPIVTTRMPGCVDVVRDRWSGLLVPPHAPRLLASGIIELLDGRDAAMAMAARASDIVRQEFGLDLTIARYITAYNELLNGPIRQRTPVVNSAPESQLRKRLS
ncbi:glycosyltransferase [Bradyrhizobium sp.]|uniref:glycosyltransferase n=1 Tax=Bradyrhizobium sp. TaxID=376 RepID=UPI002D2A6D80|nr:glycosyltransferase [Bradyrhizobium sp.]HZR72524.1 glycosyltransferase [Bradyrhizobium sp.]